MISNRGMPHSSNHDRCRKEIVGAKDITGAGKSIAIVDMNRTGKGQPRDRSRRRPDSIAQHQEQRRPLGSMHEPGNEPLAELLARQAEKARPPLTRAFRRASRRAFLWPEEAYTLQERGRALTELQGIGPYLEKLIRGWIKDPPAPFSPPAIRTGFLTFTQARAILAAQPDWFASVKGDLQMHSLWSDGSASIAEMAAAAVELNYEYIAITDHAKGLKIAGWH